MNTATAKLIQTKIRHWRLALSMTQADLSRRSGVSCPTISLIETGEHTPQAETLYKLVVDGFELTIDEFLERDPAVNQRKERATGVPMPNLRDWRIYQKVSMKKLAAYAGVTPSTIGHVERGGNASPRLAAMLLNLLGITMDDLAQSPLGDRSTEDLQSVTGITSTTREVLKNIQLDKDARAKKRANKAIDKLIRDENTRLRDETPAPSSVDWENFVPGTPESVLQSIRDLEKETRRNRARSERDDEAYRRKHAFDRE